MTKIFKRISAVAMAAAMATTMAISANAEGETGKFMGYSYDAKVTANPDTHTQTAYTFYDNLRADVYTGMQVQNAKFGTVIDSAPRTGRSGTNKTATVKLYVKDSPITAFSSHEIIPPSSDDEPWYRYVEDFYVVQ